TTATLCTEPSADLGEARLDGLAKRRHVLVREGPLGRAELEPERERAVALAHLLAAIEVEHADPVEQLAAALPHGRLAPRRPLARLGAERERERREHALEHSLRRVEVRAAGGRAPAGGRRLREERAEVVALDGRRGAARAALGHALDLAAAEVDVRRLEQGH